MVVTLPIATINRILGRVSSLPEQASEFILGEALARIRIRDDVETNSPTQTTKPLPKLPENIVSALQQLRAAYERGDWELQPKWEDVHMNVEKQLESIAGADALRLVSMKELRALNLRGIYLRAIGAGSIGVGDRVRVISRGC